MKTNEKSFLGTFVFSKLPKKRTASQWFSVLPQILFKSNTAHFYKGEVTFFYSLKSATQFMTNFKRNWTFKSPVSFSLNNPFQLVNGQINLKSNFNPLY
jgi:hypothetical protein